MMKRMQLLPIALLSFSFLTTQAQNSIVITTPKQMKFTKSDSKTILHGMETVVLQGELNKAGPYTVRIKLPSHYLVAPHTHPSVEALTVISGTMYLGMSDKFDQNKVIALPAGTFILVPAMAPHFVFSKDEGLITQVNADGPRKMDFIAGGPQSGPMKK